MRQAELLHRDSRSEMFSDRLDRVKHAVGVVLPERQDGLMRGMTTAVHSVLNIKRTPLVLR